MHDRSTTIRRDDVARSRVAFATVAVGMGAAVIAGVAALRSGGGLLAAIGAYMLAGSVVMASFGAIEAARPLRPRLRRLVARLARPVAILTH